MKETNSTTIYSGIDILKFILAICVVGIHTGIVESESSIIEWYILHGIFRLAVPFFFICSGFFVGLKLYYVNNKGQGINYIEKYVKRLGIPLIFWLIIGLPFQIYFMQYDNHIFLKLVKKLICSQWGALWYVWATIVAVVIIIPFYKKDKIKNAVILGGILYAFALVCNNYYFVIEGTTFQKFIDLYMEIFNSARTGIFEGLFFVSLGIYIAQMKCKGKMFSNGKHLFLLIVSYVTLIVEIFLIKGNTYRDDHSLFISFFHIFDSRNVDMYF